MNEFALQHPPSQPACVNRQALSCLRLTNFRNYASAALQITDGAVVLYGANGAGKTNIMEAISLLAPGRGLRSAAKSALYRQDSTSNSYPSETDNAGVPPLWAVYAELQTPHGHSVIGTSAHPDNPDASRQVRIDHNPASQTALSAHCAISWLTPQMDGLFLGAASQRRRFLDRLALCFDRAHAGRVSRFEKSWRQRNKLLSEPAYDEIWVTSLEQQLAETGVAIMATRMQLLAEICAQSALLGSHFPTVSGYLNGDVADWLEQGMPAIDIEDRIIHTAKARRQAGEFSMPGPQETDLCMEVLGKPAALASTGEQKALLISMVLAHARLQQQRFSLPSILLLDDVAAHLDPNRRAELFTLCSELDAQIWYSGTDRSIFSALTASAEFIAVENGQLTRETGSSQTIQTG